MWKFFHQLAPPPHFYRLAKALIAWLAVPGLLLIGYGSYSYETKSGCAGDMCRAGFSPRKANLALYLMGGYSNPETQQEMDAMRAKLGKHKTGASCLYINKLADVDVDVLKRMIEFDLGWMDRKYPR